MELVSRGFVVWASNNKVDLMNGFEMLDFSEFVIKHKDNIHNKDEY